MWSVSGSRNYVVQNAMRHEYIQRNRNIHGTLCFKEWTKNTVFLLTYTLIEQLTRIPFWASNIGRTGALMQSDHMNMHKRAPKQYFQRDRSIGSTTCWMLRRLETIETKQEYFYDRLDASTVTEQSKWSHIGISVFTMINCEAQTLTQG